MPLQSISVSRITEILQTAKSQGHYSVPKVLSKLPLNSGERDFMFALLHVQDDFLLQSAGRWKNWFFVTTKQLASLAKRSESTLKRARQRCARMGLIQYRCGQWGCNKATEYQILLDTFYLANKLLEHGSNITYTKAIANKQELMQWQRLRPRQRLFTGNERNGK